MSLLHFRRGKQFRKAFKELHTLPTHFKDVPFIGLGATLTTQMRKDLPAQLGLTAPVKEIIECPDKPNIFLDRIQKPSNMDIVSCVESVVVKECDILKDVGANYPVTLMYIPLDWMSMAQAHCIHLFGKPILPIEQYGLLYSCQDKQVVDYITSELKKDNPKVRLTFCSASVGMGFHSPSCTHVLHGKPPRNMIDYVQQIGRCGRHGQPSVAVMYFNNNDIGQNVDDLSDDIRNYCKTSDCLRLAMLNVFGFDKPVKELLPCKCCSNCTPKCKCVDCMLN